MTRYILLRDEGASGRRDDLAQKDREDTPPNPTLETADLTPADLRDVARDPAILSYAPEMPTRMVAPMPLDDPRPEDAVPGWGRQAIGVLATKSDTRVALLDTGIDAGHPAFRGVRVEGRDFVGSGLRDVNGHGTHLAATVLGRDCDGQRIGLLPQTRSIAVAKVLDDSGAGRSDGFFDALIWAVSSGARAVGFALSLDPEAMVREQVFAGRPETLARSVASSARFASLALFSVLLRLLSLRRAHAGGVLFLAAAGNDSRRMIAPDFETACQGLAADPGVVSVGAVTQGAVGLLTAPFSNMSPDIVAPGVGILSAAAGGGLRVWNGTSMAMAHALAASALWLDECGDARRARAALLDRATCDALPPGCAPLECGAGLVQAPPQS